MATESNSLDDGTEYGKKCPTCGREFKNRIGMLNHHAKTHGESLVRLTGDLECPTCGMSGFENNHGLGNHHAQVHGESLDLHKTTIECDICGGEFEREKCRVGERNYCSLECKNEWLRDGGARTGKDHPNYTEDVKIVCETCGEKFERKPSQEDRARFCSRDCLHKWRSENLRGKNSPLYTDSDHVRKGFTDTIKREVRKRDGEECTVCQLTQQEHLDRYDTRLHVHHIIPMHQFDDPENSNYKDNLITLCRDCHSKWDQIPGLRPLTG